MPDPVITAPPAPRTAAEIEAELMTIDVAAREIALAEPEAGGTPVQTAAEPVHDYEYEARRKGWRPETEYTGPEGKWVDAKTFVERGERFTKKLEGEIATLKAQVQGFEGTKAQFRKFFDDQMAKRDKEHTDAINALRVQRSQATRDGDDELAVELEDRIEATRKQQSDLKAEANAAAAERTAEQTAATTPAANAQDDPVLLEWIAEGNDWFRKDEVLTKHAIVVGQQLRRDGEKALGRKFLEMVKEQVQSDFPRRFKELAGSGQQTRQNASGGAGQGGTGTGNQAGYNGKTERDLPPADLAIMRQFVKEGLYTKETFLKSYFSRNGA